MASPRVTTTVAAPRVTATVATPRVKTTFGPLDNRRLKFTTLGLHPTTPAIVNSNNTSNSLEDSKTSKSLTVNLNNSVIFKKTINYVIFRTLDNSQGTSTRRYGTFLDSKIEHSGEINRSNYTKKMVDGSKQKSKDSGTETSPSKQELNKQSYFKEKIQKKYSDDSQRFKQELEIANDTTRQSVKNYEERANQTVTGDAFSTEQALIRLGDDDRHFSSDHTKLSFEPNQQQRGNDEYTRHKFTSIEGAYLLKVKECKR